MIFPSWAWYQLITSCFSKTSQTRGSCSFRIWSLPLAFRVSQPPSCPSALGSLPSQCLQAASPGKSPRPLGCKLPRPAAWGLAPGRESPHHPPGLQLLLEQSPRHAAHAPFPDLTVLCSGFAESAQPAAPQGFHLGDHMVAASRKFLKRSP